MRTGTLDGAGLVRLVRSLVVVARRVRSAGVLAVGVAVHGGAGSVGRRREGILEVAQPLGSEIEGFHVRAGLLQSPQRRLVERRAGLGVGVGVGVVVGVREGDEELLGHRGLLVRHDVPGGTERHGAWVAEITDMPDLSTWPTGMRLIVRKERPHPGTQLRFTDLDDNLLTCFATNTKGGQLADLELRHRRRARCEDRVRGVRATGLRSPPLHDTAQNRIWLEIVSLALDLLAWMPMLALTGKTRQWEPKKLRLRLFSASRAAREHRLSPLAPPARPMALDRHHPRDQRTPRPAEPRLTSRIDRPDDPHHHTGEVEPGAHPTREPDPPHPAPAPAPKDRTTQTQSPRQHTAEDS